MICLSSQISCLHKQAHASLSLTSALAFVNRINVRARSLNVSKQVSNTQSYSIVQPTPLSQKVVDFPRTVSELSFTNLVWRNKHLGTGQLFAILLDQQGSHQTSGALIGRVCGKLNFCLLNFGLLDKMFPDKMSMDGFARIETSAQKDFLRGQSHCA